jgi:Fuc2NAc and GlcNAc transferase
VTPLLAAVPAFVGALLLTGLARRIAVARSVLDVPNERSSHTSPTPSGGGLAIVAVVLSGVAVLGLTGVLGRGESWAILGGGTLVAVVGWLDDRRSLGAPTRLAAHVAAAGWALWWIGGMPFLMTGHNAQSLGMFGTVLAGFAIVWAINVTNFMDGIDGLAAGEVVTVTLTAALLLAEAHPPLAAAAALTGGAALGFLPWNWRPARIFMGDTGSGFLGFVLAVLAVASERAGALPALVWIMLYAVFATDATVTLLRRAWRGERWYSAHRSHAYQRAVQAGWSHARVTAMVLLVNMGLGLLAWRAAAQPELLGAALAGAAVVTGLAYWLVERWRPMARRAPVL